MMHRLTRFFWGSVSLKIYAPPHTAVNLFILSGIPLYDEKPLGSAFECKTERKELKNLLSLLEKKELPYEILGEKGVVPFAKKAIRRPGLILGILAGLFCLWQSTNYVWDIEVYGNERLKDGEVIEILKEHGFEIGTRHSALNLHLLCNKIPIDSKDIAWISINMMGGIAEIQVVELREKEKEPETDDLPANLVASRAGEIVRFELSSGRAVVNVGQTVEVGQMLVAGYSEKETGLHPRKSSGKVFAKTVLYESVFVPYKQTEKVEKETVLLRKSMNFLGKEIFFCKNGLQSGEEYDIIEDEYRPDVLGVALPLKIKVVSAKIYGESFRILSEKEAEEEAKRVLLERIHSITGEVLGLQFGIEKEEDGIRMEVTATCIVNIAREVKVLEAEE